MPQGKGLVDPLFLHELAELLGKTVRQLCAEASAHELAISWPLYFAAKHRMAEREQREADMKSRRK